MQVVLVMFRADGERRSFSIARDVTVLGRREDCDLRIPLTEVSRKHCRLIKDGDVLRLEDLGSSNGTFHNGERVQEAEIQPGDSVQVGPVVFAVQIDGVPADEELQPPPPPDAEATSAGEPIPTPVSAEDAEIAAEMAEAEAALQPPDEAAPAEEGAMPVEDVADADTPQSEEPLAIDLEETPNESKEA